MKVACYATHPRARDLFGELHKLDPGYVDFGVIRPPRQYTLLAKLQSFHPNRLQRDADTGFAPAMLAGLRAAGSSKLASQTGVNHVLCWGAKTYPYNVGKPQTYAYSIITDMCFHPGDVSIPAIWQPYRHRASYIRSHGDVLRGAANIFTLTRWAKQQVVDAYNISPERVVVIGAGTHIAADQPRFDQSPHGPYLLFLGSEWRRKGVDLLERAITLLKPRFPELTAVLVGNPGAGFQWKHEENPNLTFDTVMQRVRTAQAGKEATLKIASSVPLDTVKNLMRYATALVLPSRFEPFGSVLVEAQSFGTPGIGSNAGGIPEAVGEGGKVFPSGDEAALAEAIAAVWTGDEEAQRHAAYSQYQKAGGWANAGGVIHRTLQAGQAVG